MIFAVLVLALSRAHAGPACDPSSPPLAQLANASCALASVASECRDLFAAAPETLPFARECGDRRDAVSDPSILATCGSAVGAAWGEVWSALGSRVADNKKVYDECETDVNLRCKRTLAQQSFFTYSSDDQLRDVSTLDLLRKRDNVIALAQRDPMYRRKIVAAGATLPEPGDGLPDVAIVGAVRNHLNTLGVKAQCYNAAGYAHLFCFAAASLIDPSIVAGGVALAGLKGLRWTKAVLGAEKLERATSVAQSAERATTEAKAVASAEPTSYAGQTAAAVERDLVGATRELSAAERTELKKYLGDAIDPKSGEFRLTADQENEYLARRKVFRTEPAAINAKGGLVHAANEELSLLENVLARLPRYKSLSESERRLTAVKMLETCR